MNRFRRLSPNGQAAVGVCGFFVLVLLIGAMSTAIADFVGDSDDETRAAGSESSSMEDDGLDGRCTRVNQSLRDTIAQELLPADRIHLRGFRAVPANIHEPIWMVAADMQAPGLDGTDEIGVWATYWDPSEPNDSGMIKAVNSLAVQFSSWDMADPRVQDNSGIDEVEACAEAAAG